jgi:hypothetical protein
MATSSFVGFWKAGVRNNTRPLPRSGTLAWQRSGAGEGDDITVTLAPSLKQTLGETLGWQRLSPDKKEALEMIQHKIVRILNSDPEFHDSWHDIIGCAKLAADRV